MRFFLFLLGLAFVNSANADFDGTLSCVSKNTKAPTQLSLTTSRILVYMPSASNRLINGFMEDVTLVVRNSVDGAVTNEIGRRATVSLNQSYKPSKYKDHIQFNLKQLVDVETFADFRPIDECEISVLIPYDAASKVKFSAPTILSCFDSGRSQTLNCEFRPKVFGLD